MSSEFLQLLITQTWQIATLTIVVAIVARLAAKNRPHLAHALWMLVLIKCVTPPLWGHSLGVFSQLQATFAPDESNATDIERGTDTILLDASAIALSIPNIETTSAEDRSVEFFEHDELDAALEFEAQSEVGFFEYNDTASAYDETPSTIAAPNVDSKEPTANYAYYKSVLIAAIFTGAILTLLIMIFRFLRCLRQIHRQRTTEFDEPLRNRIQQLSKQLSIRRAPQIIVSNVLFGPAVLGFLRHTIVLPRCLFEIAEGEPMPGPISAQRKEVAVEATSSGRIAATHEVLPGRNGLHFLDPILAHELLHIRRGDLRTGTLQVIVQSLWWFHPAVWFSNRWLSREAERCCDEQVIAELGCTPGQYARSLLSVIESKHRLQPIPVFPGMRPVEITSQRMERIMSLKNGLIKRTPLWCWLMIVALAFVVLPGAVAQPSVDELAPKETGEDTEFPETDDVGAQLPEFEGNVFWSDADLRKHLSVRVQVKNIKSTTTLDSDREAIESKYANAGFFFVEVTAKALSSDDSKNRRLQFQIKEGRRYTVRDIRIDGNNRISNRALQQGLNLKPGDKYTELEIDQGPKNDSADSSPSREVTPYPSIPALIKTRFDVAELISKLAMDEDVDRSEAVSMLKFMVGEAMNEAQPCSVNATTVVIENNQLIVHHPQEMATRLENTLHQIRINGFAQSELNVWLAIVPEDDANQLLQKFTMQNADAKVVGNRTYTRIDGSAALVNKMEYQPIEFCVLDAREEWDLNNKITENLKVAKFACQRSLRVLNGETVSVKQYLYAAKRHLNATITTLDDELPGGLLDLTIRPLNQRLLQLSMTIHADDSSGSWTCEATDNQTYVLRGQTRIKATGERDTVLFVVSARKYERPKAGAKSVGENMYASNANRRDSVAGLIQTPERPLPDWIRDSADPLAKLVWEFRESVRGRILSTDLHTPWQIMKGLQGLRQDFLLKHDEKIINGLEWIQSGPMYQGEPWFQAEPWFQKTAHGGQAHPYNRPYTFQGHINQFAAILATCDVPLDAQFGTPQGPITMGDLIKNAQMTANDKEEVIWTLQLLCKYLPPNTEWVNTKGEKWSIERLLRIQLGKAIGPTAINGGTDGLIALTAARNAWLLTGKQLEGAWLDADTTIKKHIQLLQDHQASDGTLWSDFLRGDLDMKDFDTSSANSGALLQFLMVALSDEQLNEDWVRRSIEAAVTDLQRHRKATVRCTSLYGATNALSIYLDRVLDAGNIAGLKSTTACHEIGVTPLTGSSVVATVNGKPVLVDDILGAIRRKVEADPNLSDEHRQMILLQTLRVRTREYAEDELVVQALEATIPEDKRKLICDSLEPAFQEVCQKMMKDQKLTTDDELDQWLEDQGFTRGEMKDAFIRRQMVVGYVQSKLQVPAQIDRAVLVKYYQEHIDEYTRVEVSQVINAPHPTTVEFESVQEEIQNKLLGQLREDAQKQVLAEICAKGHVITIFDGEEPAE